MAFNYDEPVRYNEGKVDWTLLPWEHDFVIELGDELRYTSREMNDEEIKEHLFLSLLNGSAMQVLCASLLLNDKEYHPGEESMYNLPYNALEQVCRVFAYGCIKYGRGNYQLAPGLPLESYIQSMWRHLVEYLKSNLVDEESKLPHLAHIACNCFMYLWTQKTYHESNTKDTSVQR